MAQFFGYFSVAIVVIALVITFEAARKKSGREQPGTDRMNFVVRAPGIYKNIGRVCASLFGGLLLVFFILAVDDGPYFLLFVLILAGLCLFGILMVRYSKRWKLVVADDKLVLTPLFGKDREFSVQHVTHFKVDATRGIRAYSEDKRLFWVGSVSDSNYMLVSYFIENGVRAPEKINL